MKNERNTAICDRYAAGESLADLALAYTISRERCRQILRRANVFVRAPGAPAGTRSEFLGVNVTEEVKEALKSEAARRGISMSELTSSLVSEMLIGAGYDVDPGEALKAVVG